ncbi:MAG: chemotaxis protein MotB [Bacteriovoracaceae bacterium]
MGSRRDDDDEDLFEDDGGGETWLTSYADLMTLVACFFILMVAFANFEDPAFQAKAKEFSQYFNRTAPIVVDKSVNKNIQLEKPTTTKYDKENILSSKVKTEQLSQVNNIPKNDNYKVKYTASVIFEPGKIKLTKEVQSSVDVLIDLIKEKPENYYVLVEGHTDDTDIQSIKYPSNWELSAARAAKIIKKFEQSGIDKTRLVAIAYGNSNPMYPNRDKFDRPIKKNQRLNRRVVIKVLNYSDIKSKTIGPNIIFKQEKSSI